MSTNPHTRILNCVFLSHPWQVSRLNYAGLGNLRDSILIELACESTLAAQFSVMRKKRDGLAGVLTGKPLKKLGTSYSELPARLILAANPPISRTAIESAVALLPSAPGPYDSATLLVPVQEATQFANVYQYVDHFSILWDVADLPTQSLEQLTQLLAAQQCLSQERWAGLHLGGHRQRILPDGLERMTALKSIMAEFPALRAA